QPELADQDAAHWDFAGSAGGRGVVAFREIATSCHRASLGCVRKLARILFHFGHHALEFMVSVRPETLDDFQLYIQLTIQPVLLKLLAHDLIGPISVD